MQTPGQKLRRARERLKLKYRDVMEASQKLSHEYGSSEFQVGLSRLADIENKGIVPSIYRLYTLCAIYKLDFATVLRWYGVNLDQLHRDAVKFARQHSAIFETDTPDRAAIDFPVSFSSVFDQRHTSYLGGEIVKWGKVAAGVLQSAQDRPYRYAWMGTEDWSMFPLIAPGSFLLLDDRRRKPEEDNWFTEQERPVYFLELRKGFQCGWCTVRDNMLIVQTQPTSREGPHVYRRSEEVEVIGQVVGVAMRLNQARRHHIHS